jgi:hypothetical protein
LPSGHSDPAYLLREYFGNSLAELTRRNEIAIDLLWDPDADA